MSTSAKLEAWLNGTPTGGPNSDGRYPLVYADGQTYLVYCPAAQALNPALDEEPIEVFANTATAAANTATAEAAEATTASLAAQTSAANALTSQNAAAASATTASTQATAAGTSATNAAASATAAGDSATAASGSANTASTANTNAGLARDKAQKWADEAVDTTVEPAKYSARHWAQKAADSVAGGHVHTIANVTGLQTALDAKQAAGSYASATHSHAIADVTGLQTALDAKLASASFTWTNLSGKPATFAPSAHTHVIADVTGLQTALDGKQASLGYTPANKAGDLFTATMYFDAAAEIVKFTNNSAWSYQMWDAAGSAARGGLFADSGAIRLVTANFAAGVQLTDAGAVNITGNTSMGGACTVNGVLKTSSGFISSEGATAAYQLFERDALTVSWVLYATASKFRFYTGNGGFDLVDIEQPTGHIRMLRSGSEFSRANANSATLTRQPRVFVQSGDPDAAAADGDLWVW